MIDALLFEAIPLCILFMLELFRNVNLPQVKGPRGGKGIEGADFVFYISAMETERCQKGMTVAYAAHCQQEAALDR